MATLIPPIGDSLTAPSDDVETFPSSPQSPPETPPCKESLVDCERDTLTAGTVASSSYVTANGAKRKRIETTEQAVNRDGTEHTATTATSFSDDAIERLRGVRCVQVIVMDPNATQTWIVPAVYWDDVTGFKLFRVPDAGDFRDEDEREFAYGMWSTCQFEGVCLPIEESVDLTDITLLRCICVKSFEPIE